MCMASAEPLGDCTRSHMQAASWLRLSSLNFLDRARAAAKTTAKHSFRKPALVSTSPTGQTMPGSNSAHNNPVSRPYGQRGVVSSDLIVRIFVSFSFTMLVLPSLRDIRACFTCSQLRCWYFQRGALAEMASSTQSTTFRGRTDGFGGVLIAETRSTTSHMQKCSLCA